MKRIVRFGFWIFFSLLILAGIFSSCSAPAPASTITPTDDWQPIPTYIKYIPPFDIVGYTHHTPSDKSIINLEFDYPTYWIFTEYVDEYGFAVITLKDPRFLDLPTPLPDDNHPTPNDFGVVAIWLVPSKPGETVESKVAEQKDAYSNSCCATFLTDNKVAIDGFGARVIEHLVQMPETDTSLMFERRIYFFAENEIYEIYFIVAEKDRGGKFEQGYEYFFKSLKVVREK